MMSENERLEQIAKILDINMEEYKEAEKLYFEDKNDACLKYLGFEDTENEINKFEIFFYYYLSENLKCYFHNNNGRMYTKGLQNLTSDFSELLKNKINFEDFEEKENLYDDILVDILACNIEYELKIINKTLFGLSVGTNSCIYVVTDYSKLNKIKKVKSSLVQIFDTLNLEKIYGVIYQLKEEDPKFEGYIKKGDYLMEDLKKEGKFTTLFKHSRKPNVMFEYLEEEQKRNLKVIL